LVWLVEFARPDFRSLNIDYLTALALAEREGGLLFTPLQIPEEASHPWPVFVRAF
jgi:hypothetical protein